MLNIEETNENEVKDEGANEEAVQSTADENASAEDKKKKPKKLKKVLIVLSIIFAVIALLVIFADYIINGVLSICSPEAHFKYVVTKASVDTALDFYSSKDVITENILDDKTVSTKAEISLRSDGILHGITSGLGIDNEEITAELDVTKNESMNALDLSISNASGTIVSLEARADLTCGAATVRVPELSDTALLFSVDNVTNTNLPSGETVADAMPDPSLTAKLLWRYLSTASSCLDNVKRGKDELNVNGITEKKTKLTMTVDQDTVLNVLEAVLTQMEDDEDLKEHIFDKSDEIADLLMELDPAKASMYKELSDDDLYDEIMDIIDDALDSIEDAKKYLPNTKFVTVSLWINAKGEILGAEITVLKNAGLFLASLRSGNTTYTEARLYFNDETVASVEGESKSEKKLLCGDFDIRMGDSKLELEYDDIDAKTLKSGNLNGSIKIVEKHSKISCSLELESDGEETDISGSIGYRTVSLCDISAYSKKDKALSVDFHEECINYTDWADIFTEENLEKLMKKAGIYDILSAIEGF